jgi:hypothetical protein
MEFATREKEIFEDGTERAYLDDGQVVVIHATGEIRRELLDSWTIIMKDSIRTFPNAKHIYMLLDLRKMQHGLTPYARTKASEIIASVENGRTFNVALVFKDSLANALVGMFLNGLNRLLSSKLNFKKFNDMDKGLQWLRDERARHLRN